jgi:hypothetical protein
MKLTAIDVACPSCNSLNDQRAGSCYVCKTSLANGSDSSKAVSEAASDSSKDLSGAVYLIRCGTYFKIGKTKKLEQRHAQLRIQLPEKPELIHGIRTNNIDYAERHWHKRFAAQRANGEWFILSEADVQEFCQCKEIEVNRA